MHLGAVQAESATDARERFAQEKGYATWRMFCQETRTERADFDGSFRFILS
jgi:hypothetical protein